MKQLFAPVLCLLLLGCNAPTQADVLEDAVPEREEGSSARALAFPSLVDPTQSFIDTDDYSTAWKRFATPGGRLSFLAPRSWEADTAELEISRTVYVGTGEENPHPVSILLTIHPLPEQTLVEQGMEEQYDHIRSEPMTDQIARMESAFLVPRESDDRTIMVYRTTRNGRAFLHLLVPRKKSFLEIEVSDIDPVTLYPLRIFLESLQYRD